MIRKVLAWPVVFVGKSIGAFGLVIYFIGLAIKGSGFDKLERKLDALEIGVKATKNEDSSLIELVEKHYGSGKAMQVAEILEQGE